MKHTKEYYESFIGKTFKGFRFDKTNRGLYYNDGMDNLIGADFEIIRYNKRYNSFETHLWSYPADLVIEQILQSEKPKSTQFLHDKFGNKEAKECNTQVFNPEKHYFNEPKTFRSLFELSHILELNEWEFDILKRLVRCRKKGQFAEDLQKIKNTIDIYKLEYNESK